MYVIYKSNGFMIQTTGVSLQLRTLDLIWRGSFRNCFTFPNQIKTKLVCNAQNYGLAFLPPKMPNRLCFYLLLTHLNEDLFGLILIH